jgi:hypothetical protein
VQASISTIKALVPICAIPPLLPIQGHQAQGGLTASERRKDGVVFMGREPNRVKALYRPSGRIANTARGIGNLLDIHV